MASQVKAKLLNRLITVVSKLLPNLGRSFRIADKKYI